MTHEPIPANIHSAIAGFLDKCQKEARPIASSQVVGAIRRIFPGIDLPNKDLLQTFMIQASAAGFDVAFADASRDEAQRRIDNDTDGTRRRASELKERHRLM